MPEKYRAWDKVDKRYIVDEQEFIPVIVTNKGVFRLDATIKENRWILIEPERFVIESCSGRTDYNMKEIYKGDILDSNPYEYPDDDPCPYVVVFEDGAFRKKYREWDETLPKPIITMSELSTCNDVIKGNINENPDLFLTHS